MKADICISAESSNNSESLKNANEINGWKIERQELIRRRAAIREQQRLVCAFSNNPEHFHLFFLISGVAGHFQ